MLVKEGGKESRVAALALRVLQKKVRPHSVFLQGRWAVVSRRGRDLLWTTVDFGPRQGALLCGVPESSGQVFSLRLRCHVKSSTMDITAGDDRTPTHTRRDTGAVSIAILAACWRGTSCTMTSSPLPWSPCGPWSMPPSMRLVHILLHNIKEGRSNSKFTKCDLTLRRKRLDRRIDTTGIEKWALDYHRNLRSLIFCFLTPPIGRRYATNLKSSTSRSRRRVNVQQPCSRCVNGDEQGELYYEPS